MKTESEYVVECRIGEPHRKTFSRDWVFRAREKSQAFFFQFNTKKEAIEKALTVCRSFDIIYPFTKEDNFYEDETFVDFRTSRQRCCATLKSYARYWESYGYTKDDIKRAADKAIGKSFDTLDPEDPLWEQLASNIRSCWYSMGLLKDIKHADKNAWEHATLKEVPRDRVR